QGVFDLEANVPDRDITLVGPAAALVVRSSLLAEAAQEVHGKPNLFAKAAEFPTQNDPEFEMDPDALRYYKYGPTFWKRILPYWLANLTERTLVLLLPLLTVLLPLVKIVPVLYRWRFRRDVLSWYARLKATEAEVAKLPKGASESVT